MKAIINSIRALFINYQKAEVSNDNYLKEFQAFVATIDNYNANILGWIQCLLEDKLKEMFGKEFRKVIEVEIKPA